MTTAVDGPINPTPRESTAAERPGASAAPGPPGSGSEGFNAGDWLLGRRDADRRRRALVAVRGGADPREVTYGELDDLVGSAATALLAAGVRPEERVMLCMADTPELVVMFLAALRVGTVPVPVSTMLTSKDLTDLVVDSRARMLVATAEFSRASAVAAAASAYLRDLVVVGGPTPAVHNTRCRDWPAFLAAGATTSAGESGWLTGYDSPGFWLYTSGTTGTPKAAMHRHGSLHDTAQTYARDVLGIGPDDVCFSVAKLFFAYGLGNSLTFPFSVGAGTILDAARPTPATVARILTEQRPTLFFAGPTFYASMLAADLPSDTFASVRLCVSAGEPFPAELLDRFSRRFDVEVLDGIGSTEMLHIFLSNRPGRVRPGSTGEPVAGYQLRIVDEHDNPVPDGEPGQLLVAGSSAATGYWCRTEVSRRVFHGPWTRTGDIYVRDAKGYYTCLGRSGDVLKAAGIWVSPTEVEQRLRQHPAVAAAVVVAVPDADGLEKPVACVVPAPEATIDEADLVAFCRAGLAAFKRPRRVLVIDALPLTGTGKVARHQVRELAAARLAGTPPARAESPGP